MAYTLELTESDVSVIAYVGHRYNWSNALRYLKAGTNEIAEHEAWEIHEAFEEDTEGGHSMFPMLDDTSGLFAKLQDFWGSIV